MQSEGRRCYPFYLVPYRTLGGIVTMLNPSVSEPNARGLHHFETRANFEFSLLLDALWALESRHHHRNESIMSRDQGYEGTEGGDWESDILVEFEHYLSLRYLTLFGWRKIGEWRCSCRL